ncbi:hypothetical protein [endosymbiont of Lamellibrachia barhami]|uniref:hypothetical protein n=1 Tax=endosymbiont of Lamellibrachia barhami TaxID=205975 RepID=UPI0015B01FB2|nr:hypothetical protein [endosymbiont of Lamellibrachia barhami]
MRISLILFILVAIVLTGCATTKETHPTRVSAGDLWWGNDRLEAYLESRKRELKSMQKHALLLESRLYDREEKLKSLDRSLKAESAKAENIEHKQREIERAVSKKRTELARVVKEVKGLKVELAKFESLLATAKERDKQIVKERMAEYEVEIEDLGAEVAVLERSIDRILLVRAKHALETE